MKRIGLRINGERSDVEVAEDTPLLYVLRNDLNLKGARLGCGEGYCGACTVIVNGRAMQACTTPLWSIEDAEIVTIEALAERHDPLITAFRDLRAAQCGYCINGIIMTVRAMLDQHPDLDDEAIRAELSERNLCRCGTHSRILAAIRQVMSPPASPVPASTTR